MGTKVPVSRAGVERRRSVFGRRLRPVQSRRRTYANPVLFTGTPAAGSYRCVAIKMSDVIRMMPAASFGTCVGGTEYSGDIYRAGENGWNGQGTVVSEGWPVRHQPRSPGLPVVVAGPAL